MADCICRHDKSAEFRCKDTGRRNKPLKSESHYYVPYYYVYFASDHLNLVVDFYPRFSQTVMNCLHNLLTLSLVPRLVH
jgi:hypothetical protein